MPDPPPPDAAPPDDLRETTVSSQSLYQGRVVNLRRDTVRLADGREAVREVVEHAPSVVILAFDDAERILFVRQWRTPAGRALLELPAGVVEPGEAPPAAAARELQEEVGLRPGRLEPLGGFYVAPGWASEYLYGFLAHACRPAPLPPDSDERIQVERHFLAEALALIREGLIEDAKSLVLLQALALRESDAAPAPSPPPA